MPNQPVPAAVTGLPNSTLPHHRLGDRVVVELTGTITSRNAENDVYSIQPDDPRSASIHVKPEYIFPEDDEPVLLCPAPGAFADLHDAVFRTVCFVTTLEAAVDGDLRHSKEGWNSVSILLGEARKAAVAARAALDRLPPPTEPGVAVTDGGRAYLLLRSIIDRLHIEGDTATFILTPEIADELAAFGSESEDLEDDDPAEDSDPAEDGHDNEADVWHADNQDDEQAVLAQLAGRLEPRERRDQARHS